ncbi:heavy metal translocating P-type ATPase [Psychrobacter arenosus]|uniref:heavy metal translocating P-type ATPase n=1 Tax=Psychrobacter arenosus TaxID=256326 RepID=UPI00191B115D|nr:heavy metal translocating P-type ATPase [Psychrobacter arenosus]
MQESQATEFTEYRGSGYSLNEGLVLPPAGHCFHCGDPVPKPPFFSDILGERREMCCLGCQLASQSIVEAGLEQYYLDRSEINRTASLPAEMTRLQAYDRDDIKSQFVYQQEGHSVAELSVNNLRCAACTWLIESRLDEIDGIDKCQVNLTNQRMRIIWDEDKLPISQILATISEIGYEAKPYRQDSHEAMLARHNKKMLLRLGIAALGAMQSMMYAVALYFGEYGEILVNQRDFLRWVSLFVSIPVFFYAGIPFFTSAWSAVRARQVNMDVPVSVALIVTFFASLYATITGSGQTYFDSVSMFIFFLLAGRYIEHNARLKAASMANDLVVIEPVLVQKVASDEAAAEQLLAAVSATQATSEFLHNELPAATKQETARIANELTRQYRLGSVGQGASDGEADNKEAANIAAEVSSKAATETMITAQGLQVGDIVMVAAGSEIISDGILLSETATVSQSLLTGEGDLIVKQQGDYVVGGSQNDSQPFYMLVTALVEDSQIGLIDRLMNRAMSEKPKIAQKADELARWFVARILVLSVLVFAGWYLVDPSQAIWATVAVLVATCPCALSLATPIALTVATNRLASYGFLTTRGHTLQTLAEITHVAFDKTGTLTNGKPNLLNIEVQPLAEQSDEELLAIAAALEVGSRHPVAHALLTAAYQMHLPATATRLNYPAGGVEAVVTTASGAQTYRIGHFEFAVDYELSSAADLRPDLLANRASSAVVLSVQTNSDTTTSWQPLAFFYFNDSVRDTAKDLIEQLKARNLHPVMLTGDPSPQALVLAQELGIAEAYNGLSPSDKVTHIQRLQSAGARVLMVGDGINDAPVLAAADVSSSIAGAADLAQVSSDSVILNGKISAISDAKRVADKSQKIIKQNFRWALIYNFSVLIPAVFGYVPPWLAAIGMSLSSLFVVLNALRLKRA